MVDVMCENPVDGMVSGWKVWMKVRDSVDAKEPNGSFSLTVKVCRKRIDLTAMGGGDRLCK